MKKNSSPNLNQFKIIVCGHVFVSGPTQALVEYLTSKNRAGEILFIGHPLFPGQNNENTSFCFYYQKGELIKKEYHRHFSTFSPLCYFIDFLLSCFWGLKTKQKWDLFIGLNNLNALSGLVLKLLGQVKKVIFYGVDYVPQRFENPLMNYLYHLTDKICVYHVDQVWSLSPKMVEARLKYKNIKIKKSKNKIVPMGVWFNEIKRPPFNKIKKHTLVFMGHLLKKQGVQTVIKAMPEIIKKIPDFQFMIIGTGEYGAELKRLVKKMSLTDKVTFTGLIKNYQKMVQLISQSACAVALYQKGNKQRNFTYYTDPGKIKDYLGAGLPIILTDVPPNAQEIEKAGCGVIINDNKKEVAQAVIKIMENEKKLKQYKKNALKLAQKYDWPKIYSQAFR